ncbi:MAG: acyl carrier protein [Oligoflexia bacterium]|nr:acyl carrier protein [Oligoflexia bacterium]
MNRDEIVNKVNDMLMQNFELTEDKLLPSSRFVEDLGLDSLDAVDMLVHLENQLNVKVDVEKFREVRTLGNVYDLVYEMSKELT